MGPFQAPQHWDQSAWSLAVGLVATAVGIASFLVAVRAADKAASAERTSDESKAEVTNRLASMRIAGLVFDLVRAGELICETLDSAMFSSGCRSWKEISPRLRSAIERSAEDHDLAEAIRSDLLVIAGMINDSLGELQAGAQVEDARVELVVEVRRVTDDARQLWADIETEVPA